MMLIVVMSLPVADCSTFLLLRQEKLDRQWFDQWFGGTTNVEVDDEHRRRRPGSSATSCRSSAK